MRILNKDQRVIAGEPHLTAREVAEELGVGLKSINSLLDAREIGYRHINGLRLIPQSEVNRILEDSYVEPLTEAS